ncbi:hypothetical protein Athai_31140 [Actinocatenispora thailandica]|uniref:Glycosyltransferase RgtA/B/C/D-like domain-containing protein n=1 Tax=Actinocatenispora thailandica TaxID=227318 RepID=A0A7R7DQ33_9ACTN|nr:hypothetical protein [Actinocatenispora thailandica]BCJ35611.1 hypothetical protein Athai_31140 [Actinocatenispora thailandica]
MRGQIVGSPAVSPTAAPGSGIRLLRRPGFWLVVVAAGYTAAMLVLVAPHLPLGADESLYATQVSPRVPALNWTAARARGITYLIAPILQVTGSVTALRSYLAVLSGLALTAGYWPWLRAVRRPGTVPVAALLFAGLWSGLLYGAADLPNIWVGFAAVAAAGWFVRYGQHPTWPAALGVAVPLAVIALMRPSDAAWVAFPLVAAMVLVRRWRRPGLLLAVVGGCLVGAAEWMIEAQLRYGGVAARLHEASRQQGGLGWHPIGVAYQLRALNGPLLCRPCSLHHLASPQAWLIRGWWLAIPVLVVAALVVAYRQRQLAAIALPSAVGASIALAYLVTIDYAAPRFLLPAYMLLALPVASLFAALPAMVPRRARPVLVVGFVLLFLAHETAQVGTLWRIVHRADPSAAGAAELHRLGVRRPCVLVGVRRTQMAYRLGCTTSIPAEMYGYLGREQVVFLTWHRNDPRGRDWQRHPMPRPTGVAPWYAFVAPPP